MFWPGTDDSAEKKSSGRDRIGQDMCGDYRCIAGAWRLFFDISGVAEKSTGLTDAGHGKVTLKSIEP